MGGVNLNGLVQLYAPYCEPRQPPSRYSPPLPIYHCLALSGREYYKCSPPQMTMTAITTDVNSNDGITTVTRQLVMGNGMTNAVATTIILLYI
jgi:hypothetical protein